MSDWSEIRDCEGKIFTVIASSSIGRIAYRETEAGVIELCVEAKETPIPDRFRMNLPADDGWVFQPQHNLFTRLASSKVVVGQMLYYAIVT